MERRTDMAREDEMREVIQDLMAEVVDVESLAKTYATIISEANLQLAFIAEQISKENKIN